MCQAIVRLPSHPRHMDKDHTATLYWKFLLISQTSLLLTDRFHGTSQLCHSILLSEMQKIETLVKYLHWYVTTVQSNCYNKDTKGTEPSVRIMEAFILES